MQKQKENLKYKYEKYEKKRRRACLKKVTSVSNISFQKLFNPKVKKAKKINIRIVPNNIFVTLQSLKKKQVIFNISAGKIKQHVSKKSLKYKSKIILPAVLKKIKTKIKIREIIIIQLNCPRMLKKRILRIIKDTYKDNYIFFILDKKKVFNGCKTKKQKRKKRKGFRIFK
jgi:hypothetical protein